MTIDIDELRNDAKTAHFGHTPLEVPGSEMLELLDRLEAAESECLEQARLNGMGASREAALLAKLEAAEENRSHFLVKIGKLYAQCDALHAKIEQMEKQVPICRAEDLRHAEILLPSLGLMPEDKLYALPGAQPAPSVPDDIVREVLRDCCGTFHGSRHRITCEKYKGKRDQETSCEDE